MARMELNRTPTSMVTHTVMSSVLRNDAATIESEIPVPKAGYAAKHAGHFGSKASTSVGTDHRVTCANFRVRNDGWGLPSAHSFDSRRDIVGSRVQQVVLFICDSHFRSKTKLPLPALRSSPRGNDHDGEPTTW